MLNKKKNNKGFTLVELLVVIAIIGILAVVAVPALFKNIEKGKVAELEADISAIRSAALSYYADKGTYPSGKLTGSEAATGNGREILKEIESLSNPFGATYEINEATPPAALTLTINASKLSAAGLEKLRTDLPGMVNEGNSSNIIVTIISGNSSN